MIEKQKAILHHLASDPLLLWMLVFLAGFLVLGMLTGFFRVRRIQPGALRWKQIRIEIVVIAIGFATSGLFIGAWTNFLKSTGWIQFNLAPAAWWQIVLEFLLYFVLFDTWFYWLHRAVHIEPLYKLIHKWHHYSTAPTVFTTVSVNPLETLFSGGFLPLMTAVITLHRDSMVFIGPFAALMGLYVHSGYEFLPRWWNKSWATKWFITATFHDQHHKYFNYNYGGYTTLWDRLCGTVRKKYEHDFENPKARRLNALAAKDHAAV